MTPERVHSDEADLRISREIDAPRPRVWRAWTEPRDVERWWGPRGFSTRVEQLDLRVGGRSRYVMVGPDGAEYPSVGVFREIVPQERIVTTDEFGEDFESAGLDLPSGIVLTVELEDLPDQRTRLALRIAHPDAEERRKHEEMGVVAGWQSSLDCLESHLRGTGR